MSYPATEAGDISNDSLFSDEMEFDRAEKPQNDEENAAEDAPQEEQNQQSRDAEVYRDRDAPVESQPEPEPEPEQGPPPPPAAAFLKPRKTATKPPQKWEPVNLAVPEDDPEDEFDIGSAQKPVYEEDGDNQPEAAKKKKKITFLHGEPDMQGDINNCFDEPGLLYRIVDKKNKTWAFYNDSLAFEVHVTCTFTKSNKIEALENTTIKRADNGDLIAEVTVYPCETEMFIKGFVNGFSTKLRAIPLSDDYYNDRSAVQRDQTIQNEIDAIRAIAGDETDSEEILRICLENDLPFVDLAFPPVQESIDAGSSKPFKQLPWARPKMYLKPEQVDQIRLFRDGITPGDVNQGELGDCWLLCAIATGAENPRAIMQMFRHPRGAEAGRQERAIGAYRVTFNKNGLWRSVLVDDYLPLVANTPKFAHSNDPCELWPSILEKAFAKLHKSYAMIQTGDPVHALTDMTGFPSMRFDDPWAEAQSGGTAGQELFKQLDGWNKDGYQMIITTPGKAPAITPGSNNVPDFSEEPEFEKLMAGTGLLPGHAYTVLDVKNFEKEKVQLVKIRNSWKHGDEWSGNWSRTSPLWDKHASIKSACQFDPNDKESIWMNFDDVLKYFIGGGVHFRKNDSVDYRIPITFSDCRPSAIFQIEVSEPVTLFLTLSNVDYRGLRAEDNTSNEYPPVMLSLCAPISKGDDVYKVRLNSSADITQPSDNKWTFLEAREIAMQVRLDPNEGPYLLIPRMLETETTSGGANVGEPYEQLVNPAHFVNNYANSFPKEATGNRKEIPVTIGVRSDVPLDASSVLVQFRKIDGSNSVFENFPKFPADDVEDLPELYFQVKDSTKGFADEKTGGNL